MGDQFDYLKSLSLQYQQALEKDKQDNEKEEIELNTEIDKIRDLMTQLEVLSERPEWPDSFIQVNRLAYIPATLIHTSEYFVKLGSEFYALMSLKETLAYLQRKIDRAQDLLETLKLQQQQLKERLNIVTTTFSETTDETNDMPLELVSDKGIAHKTSSGFYEIIEPYNEDEEREFYDRRKKLKAKQMKTKKKEETDNSLQTLNELYEMESVMYDLKESSIGTVASNNEVTTRVTAILKQSGVYESLQTDDVITNYYYKNMKSGDSISTSTLDDQSLNELLVKVLSIEPTVYNSKLN